MRNMNKKTLLRLFACSLAITLAQFAGPAMAQCCLPAGLAAVWPPGSGLANGLGGQYIEYRTVPPDYPWHAGYYHPAWGLPVALVVPPRATNQAHYSWGVGGTRTTAIWHQFSRDYPGPGTIDRRGLLAPPRWPSSTDQLGVYYVRGPW